MIIEQAGSDGGTEVKSRGNALLRVHAFLIL